MDTLDLLKSLTMGVNNKINQEQESEIEYIVDTSLSNKRKKSAPPIIKEVVKNKSDFDAIQDEISDSELFYDESVEETFDFVEDEVDLEDSPIIDDDSLEGQLENDFSDEIIEESPECFEYFDSVSEDIGNLDGLDLIGNNKIEKDTVDIKNDGHILEELKQEKKKENKIQRNGNPFKRGPRKRKESFGSVKSDNVKNEETSLLPSVNGEVNIQSDAEGVLQQLDDNILSNTDILEDISEELHKLDDSEFDSLFSDFSDFSDDEEKIEKETISEKVESFDKDDSTFDGVQYVDEVQNCEDIVDDVQVEEMSDSILSDNEIVEEPIIEEPLKEVKVESIDNDFSFLDSVSNKSVDKLEKEIETDVENDEEAKFKNCVYYKGMSVDEFLRANSDYREEIYVEHFFSKDLLKSLMDSGFLLKKKGKYRI